MAKMRGGLGKGLNALIPEGKIDFEEDNIPTQKDIISIDINKIKPNENQPRKLFDQEKLESLADSIKVHGIIQPVVARKIRKDAFELIAGERRWRAARLAGLKEIPCIIKDISEKERMEIALVENIQREDLNPIEEGLAYKALIDIHELTQEDISIVVGRSRPYITNTMRLLNLPKDVQQMVRDNKLSGGHGRALLGIDNHNVLLEVAKKVASEQISVRETEKIVSELYSEKIKQKNKNKKQKDSTLLYLEDTLKGVLGTKVSIVKGKKKGKIEIEYYGDDELERLIDILQTR